MRSSILRLFVNKKMFGIEVAVNNKRLEVAMTSKSNILGSEVLLNLVSHQLVAWVIVKISNSYKYVGLLV